MALKYTARILDHLSHQRYQPARAALIARDMRVADDDLEIFESAIDALATEGRIEVAEDGRVRLPAMPNEITGRLKLNPRGFGFIVPASPYREGDLFVPQGSTGDAITGDTVKARVRRQHWRSKAKSGRSDTIGEIIEVLERGREHFVGTLGRRGDQWMVDPDGRILHDAVIIRDPHAKNAREGDKVVIELVHYPEEEYWAEGVIVQVLGESGQPDVETAAVIAAHGLPGEFPEDAVREAGAATRRFDAEVAAPETIEQRLDLRDRFIFTIDPPDARDFDDAISLERDETTGNWTLGVHIADVAHFVRPGTVLDAEAQERANSVYLPRHVIPMLPEVLSNGICSLQEGVPRFTKSVFIDFDSKGRPVGQRLAATIIQSAKRLTYLEAQALIDGDRKEARKQARTEPVYTDELIDALQAANRLAKTLRKRRLRDGMIVLDLPEVELVFDDDGNVVDAVPEDDAYTHTIIEMFMVEANEALARTFDSLQIPVLRRIHPDPSYGDMAELQLYARAVGQRIPDEPTRHDLQQLLNATRGSASGRAIHFAVLRTLTRATYSPAVIGHFALASDHYAHFTSPIRRYPDLALHRALEAFLDHTSNGAKVPGGRGRDKLGQALREDARVPDEGALITLGRHCSDSEDVAETAERELRSYLVMRFLADNHLGDVFDGVVTGATAAGLFVSIERFLIEGLVKPTEMNNGQRGERWAPDQQAGRLIAKRSGSVVGVGDVVKVQIVQVDPGSRHLDLRLVEFPERSVHADSVEAPRPRKRGPEKRKRGRGRRR